MQRINRNSATKSRNSVIGDVKSWQSLAFMVLPSSGLFITSFKGGKIWEENSEKNSNKFKQLKYYAF